MVQVTQSDERAKRLGRSSSKPKRSASQKKTLNQAQKASSRAEASDNPTDKIRWTIMLYIAADGNIANFGVESLKQLNHSIATCVGPDDEAEVVVAAQFA